jgi:aerobic C4-dicarboxylate transport protein
MVMPAGYTFNADGTAIYLGMGAIFIAQATNTHLSLRDQVVILVVLMFTSKGSAGVAGAGFVTLAATLASLHQVPVAGLVLLLGVDRLTNAARAVVNVIGSCVATVVVAKWEKAFDTERAGLVLGDSSVDSLSVSVRVRGEKKPQISRPERSGVERSAVCFPTQPGTQSKVVGHSGCSAC